MIKCVLDEHGCIDLLAVMRIMNQVDQEQVWAIAYELAALMQRLWPAGNCALVESLAQIHIHRDGFVHEKSLLALPASAGSKLQDASHQLRPAQKANPTSNSTSTAETDAKSQSQQNPATTTKENQPSTTPQDPSKQQQQQQQQLPPSPPITPELSELIRRRPAATESELVSSLGIALFWALDYGIPDDEERKLSMTMEYLIFKSQSELTLEEILEICIKRLPIATKTNADLHYRQVCKALIGDTIELSIFLDKIYKATMELSGLAGANQRRRATAVTGTGVGNNNSTADGLMDECCMAAAAAAAKRCHKSLSNGDGDDFCDKILSHQYHHHHHHRDHQHGALDELELPLASLRALKIDDWARLWMQVIKEMRQRSKFKHLGVITSTGRHGLNCSNLG